MKRDNEKDFTVMVENEYLKNGIFQIVCVFRWKKLIRDC